MSFLQTVLPCALYLEPCAFVLGISNTKWGVKAKKGVKKVANSFWIIYIKVVMRERRRLAAEKTFVASMYEFGM